NASPNVDGSAAPCTGAPNFVCGVSSVQLYVRNFGDTGDGVALGPAVAIPSSGAPVRYDPSAPGSATAPFYFDYFTPGGFILPSGIDRNAAQISAKARTLLPDGATYAEAATEWSDIATTTNTASANLLAPASNTTVFMDGAAHSVSFSVRLDRPSLSKAPKLNVTLVRNGTWVPVFLNGTASGSTNSTVEATEIVGSTYYFNFTNENTLSQGEYLLNVSGVVNDTLTPLDAYAWRFFGVETAGPALTLAGVTAPSDYGWPASITDDYVRPVFNLTFAIDSTVANMTQGGLYAKLEKNDASAPTIPSSQYQVLLKGFAQSSATRWLAYYEVHLPATAVDGNYFRLRVWARSDAIAPPDSGLNNTTASRVLRPDAAPPVPTLLRADTTATINQTELRLVGSSEDLMSGTARVNVSLYDVTADQTFVWDENFVGAWMPGDRASYMTSDLMLTANHPGQPSGSSYVRNVFVTSARAADGRDVALWQINSTTRPRLLASGNPDPNVGGVPFDAIRLDPGHLYRVRVNATDRSGLANETESTFRFDTTPPAFAGPFAFPSSAINAAGSVIVSAYAQDAWCVDRVVLNGTSPVTFTNVSA